MDRSPRSALSHTFVHERSRRYRGRANPPCGSRDGIRCHTLVARVWPGLADISAFAAALTIPVGNFRCFSARTIPAFRQTILLVIPESATRCPVTLYGATLGVAKEDADDDGGEGTRTRVLVVGGWGRCGSTLLDMLLGQIDGFVSAGEVRELWLRGCVEDRPCGCGDALQQLRVLVAGRQGGVRRVGPARPRDDPAGPLPAGTGPGGCHALLAPGERSDGADRREVLRTTRSAA